MKPGEREALVEGAPQRSPGRLLQASIWKTRRDLTQYSQRAGRQWITRAMASRNRRLRPYYADKSDGRPWRGSRLALVGQQGARVFLKEAIQQVRCEVVLRAYDDLEGEVD